jgi:hypothetical protein
MRTLLVLSLLAVLAACGRRDGGSERERLENEFREILTGATLAGRFSTTGRDQLSEDRYTISSVTKLGGDLWTINTRIQYGERDVTAPVPVRVLWAGDTPVITLTDAAIPGVGTFSARVLFYRGQYAGTWSSSRHGGQMIGRIEKGGE